MTNLARITVVATLSVSLMVAALPALSSAQDVISDVEADARIADIEAFVVDIDADLAAFRSDRLHPAVVVEATGGDPNLISDWVAAETRWVPYAGTLRGPRGVLMDRTGNSLDRALLLADLLAMAGFETRLVRTELPLGLAAEIAGRELTRETDRTGEGSIGAADVAAGFRDRASRAAADLISMLPPSAGATGATSSEVAEAMADHWWIQLETDDGWVDLDPLLGSDARARPPASDVMGLSEVPADLHHEVTIRLVIEREEGDLRTDEVPLEHTLVMATSTPLASLDVSFESWLDRDAGPEDVSAFDDMAELAGFWRPVLKVGEETLRGDWFTAAGTLAAPDELVVVEKVADAASALGDLGGDSDAEVSASRLTGAWLDFAVRHPSGSVRTERRELFDADGLEVAPADEALRRGLAFLGETSILMSTAATHPDAISEAYLQNWIDARPALIALVFLAAGREDERIGPSLDILRQRPLDLLLMTSARSRWHPSPGTTFLAGPNIWARHLLFESVDGEVASATAIDIIVNDVDVLGTVGVDEHLSRLQQGVVDTLVEHVLPGEQPGLNAWERFDQRELEGIDWVTLAGPEDLAATDTTSFPSADLDRMTSSLAAGHTVVTATEPRLFRGEPFMDWWRVAPDGSTLGIGYRGWGQDTTERGAIDPRVRQIDPRVRARFEGVQKNGACKKFETAITAVDWVVVGDTQEFRRPDLDTCK